MVKKHNKILKKLLKLVQLSFFILCIVFITIFYIESKDNIVKVLENANLEYLLLSVFSWQIVILIAPLFSYFVLKSQQCKVPYPFMLEIFINRLPAKYLPGGIWQTVARFHDLTKKGVKKKELSILVFYENFWSVIIAAFIGGLGVYYYHSDTYWGKIALLTFFVSLLVCPVLFLMKKLALVFSFRCYLKLSFVSFGFWLFASLSFYCYISAFNLITNEVNFLSLAASYIFSWLVGFVSLFAPQGIGVFELVMVQTSKLNLSLEEAIILIAGFRIIVFISDLISYFLSLIICRFPFVHSKN